MNPRRCVRAVKRPTVLISSLCVIIGFLLGIIFPRSWEKQGVQTPPAANTAPNPAPAPDAAVPIPKAATAPGASAGGVSSAPAQSPLDVKDNLSLLEAACAVNRALKNGDYASLAAAAHPTKGVTFTPYSSVDPETDLTFTPDQLRNLAQDATVYAWGFVDGRGSLIEMTVTDYLKRYVYNADYTKAPQVGVDQVMMQGNALENIAEAYPDGRFVDFCYPNGLDSASEGMDWCSLKLAFEPGESGWLLVGIVHGEWTI